MVSYALKRTVNVNILIHKESDLLHVCWYCKIYLMFFTTHSQNWKSSVCHIPHKDMFALKNILYKYILCICMSCCLYMFFFSCFVLFDTSVFSFRQKNVTRNNIQHLLYSDWSRSINLIYMHIYLKHLTDIARLSLTFIYALRL